MNRGQLRTRLSLRLRLPPAGDPLLDEPTLNDMLAAALTDVSAVADWPWLLTSASVTFTAGLGPLPSTCVKVRELVVNGRRGKPSELAQFLDQVATVDSYLWCVIGSNIQLSPAPTTSPTNTLYFIQPEPALTLDTSSPLMPEAHQATVIARAAYLAETRRARADAAQFHNAEYETALHRMMDATKRVTRPRQIRESGREWWATW